MRTRLFGLVALILGLVSLAQASTNDLTGLLQKGLFDEEANRDLNAAISDYQTLATDFDKDRQLAATAIFRLGECYRKLGRTNDAVVQYQRIVRDFSDQPTLVNLSRQNLAGLGSTGNPSTAQQPSANSEQARELQWVKKLQGMPLSDVLQTAPTVLTDATLINLIYQYNQTELDLIRLRTDHGEEHADVKKTQAIQSALQAKIKERLDGLSRVLSMELGASAPASGGDLGTQESVVTDEEQKQIHDIQAMIQNSPDLINAPGADDKTPLQLAAEKGQLTVAKYLLEHGANVDAHNNRIIKSPLYFGADNGHKAMVELLLSRGADVNGAGGPNPLARAISKDFIEVVETLVAHKADVNAYTGNNGQRVMHAAVSGGDTNLIQLLIEHGADVDATDFDGDTPLHLSAGSAAAVKILLDAKANIEARDDNGDTPLALAARDGKTKTVTFLLDSGASVDATNKTGVTPLLHAIWGGHVDVARELLEHHPDPNSEKGLLIQAIQEQHGNSAELVQALLEYKADPNLPGSFGLTPLQAAIEKNQADSVELLLQHGADPNGPPGTSESPLCLAIDHNAGNRIVELLLDKGADPNARSHDGQVPLMRTYDPEIIRELVAHKADVNARGPNGMTPLMSGLYRTDVLNILLAGNATPDLQDDNGNTALHRAVSSGLTNAVQLLLENKANPNIQNNAGITPLDIARALLLPPQVGVSYTLPRPSAESANFMIAALTQAGGLANLPKRDRIEVRRGSSSYEMDVFFKGAQDWNHFSLLESIAVAYGLVGTQPAGEWHASTGPRASSFNLKLRFPDFKNVVIYRRTGNSAKQTAINVDVESILNSGDCSRDVWLQWGDVIEIPETDHPVEEVWPGLADSITDAMSKCLAREVTVKIKSESTTLKLAPEFIPPAPANLWRTLVHSSFMLRSVLDNSKLIRVSSDLSRVKVTRHNSQTHETAEWTVDCNSKDDTLWLRDGDVIEVPER